MSSEGHKLGRWIVPLAAVAIAVTARASSDPVRAAPDPEYVIDRWETDQGLPENSATCMVQDGDGYLWFGTFRGLVRFDAARLVVFDPTNTPALPSDKVVGLHLDRAGRMWVSTVKGLVRRDRDTWVTLGPADGWTGDFARSFAERPNGELLVTAFDGGVFEFRGSRFTALPPVPGAARGCVALVSESGRWWVARSDFIGEWDGQRWVRTMETPTDRSVEVACAASRDGGLWVLIDRELRKVRAGAELSRVELPEAAGGLWGLYEDSGGNIWISTHDRGVCRVTPAGAMRRWTAGAGLAYHGTRFVAEDRERNIWIGSSGGGLTRFKPARFRMFTAHNGLDEPVVTSVCADPGGGVWIGTYGRGLYRVPPGGDRAERCEGGAGYVQSLLLDRTGRLWVGTYGQGVWAIRGAQSVAVTAEEGIGHSATALFEDSLGRIWVGGLLGVGRVEGDRVLAVDRESPVPSATAFAQDADGLVWTANEEGVFRWSGDRFAEVIGPRGEPLRGVVCLKPVPGAMWMGTRAAGLLRWRPDRLDRVGAAGGYPVSSAHAIVESGDGYWWVPSNRGVVRVRRADMEAAADGGHRLDSQVLDRADGLESGECAIGQQPVCAVDAAGHIWFATVKGAAVIDPLGVRRNSAPPPVRIETVGFERSGGGTLDADPGGPVVLPPGSKHIEIRYAALSLGAPEKVRFEIMLQGLDQEWRPAGPARVKTYESLRPGEYVFRVRAANDDGVWNTEGAALAFSVTPFYWQTVWFRAMAGVTVLAGGVALTWRTMRARALRDRERLELRRQRDELIHLTRVTMLGELSGSLAHELNQPLTAILSNAQAAQRFLGRDPPETGEVREILADIVKEDRRAGEIIHRLRALLKKGEVSRQPVRIGEVIGDVLRLVRGDLVARNVEVRVEAPEDLRPVLADRVQLQQVLLNLVLNASDAMTETGAGAGVRPAMTVRAERSGDRWVQVSVIDQGPGVARDRLGRVFEPFYTTKRNGMGLGLPMCRTIIAAHGGRIWIENNPDRGAAARFTLAVAGEPP